MLGVFFGVLVVEAAAAAAAGVAGIVGAIVVGAVGAAETGIAQELGNPLENFPRGPHCLITCCSRTAPWCPWASWRGAALSRIQYTNLFSPP